MAGLPRRPPDETLEENQIAPILGLRVVEASAAKSLQSATG